jgi:NitT/TauT family transport system substrate-binding protein
MNRWKALIGIVMTVCLVMISSCSKTPPTTTKLDKIRLVGTIGPMSIPLAYMKEQNSLASIANETTLDVWANPTQLQAIITGGQGDFVALPVNSAAVFYNKGISLKLLDCSVWNILYLVTSDTTVKSLSDLKGKQVVVPYQGAIPDAIFQTVLKEQGLDSGKDLSIFYAADPVQAAQLLLSGKEKYALLSEPSATSVILKGQSTGITFVRALNMLTEWQKSADGAKTPIAGTVVLGSLKDRPDIIETFLTEYQKAVQWMMTHPQEAGELGASILADQGFSAEAWTQSTQNVSWNFVSAVNAQPDIEKFFKTLNNVSPNFIGGKLPDDGFYFGR